MQAGQAGIIGKIWKEINCMKVSNSLTIQNILTIQNGVDRDIILCYNSHRKKEKELQKATKSWLSCRAGKRKEEENDKRSNDR